MTRKMISLLLAAMLSLGLFLPAALAEENAAQTRYIYTENHAPLTVRAEPYGEVIGTVDYGTEVQLTEILNDRWAVIQVQSAQGSELQGVVSLRYVISVNPDEMEKTFAEEAESLTGDALLDINAEFGSATEVEPYEISVRPTRATSWANMRWIPSETGMILAQYKATEKLIVLKEMAHYLQVMDPDTGDVGYIHKRFAIQ